MFAVHQPISLVLALLPAGLATFEFRKWKVCAPELKMKALLRFWLLLGFAVYLFSTAFVYARHNSLAKGHTSAVITGLQSMETIWLMALLGGIGALLLFTLVARLLTAVLKLLFNRYLAKKGAGGSSQ